MIFKKSQIDNLHANLVERVMLLIAISAYNYFIFPFASRIRRISMVILYTFIYALAANSANARELDAFGNAWNNKIYSQRPISADDVRWALENNYDINTVACGGPCKTEFHNSSLVCWNEASKPYSIDLYQTAQSLRFRRGRSMEDILSTSPSYTPFGTRLNQIKLIEANCSRDAAVLVKSFLTDIFQLQNMYFRDLNDKAAPNNRVLKAERDRRYLENLNDKCTAASVTIRSNPECEPILGKVIVQERVDRERRSEIEGRRIAATKNRINGYRDFKFGLEKQTVEDLKGCNEYHRRDDFVLSGNGCYNIAGEKRNIRFTFGKLGLSDIQVYLGLFDEAISSEISRSLTEKYRLSYTPSDNVKSLFNSGKIKELPIYAFEDWSVIYVVERARDGKLLISLLYLTDERAAAVKANTLNLYISLGDGLKRVKAGEL